MPEEIAAEVVARGADDAGLATVRTTRRTTDA